MCILLVWWGFFFGVLIDDESLKTNGSKILFPFLQAQILEFGLAVHEKVVPQDMRPLHKKLVDQFFVMKSSLGIQVLT